MNKVGIVVWYGNLKNLQKYQFFPFESKQCSFPKLQHFSVNHIALCTQTIFEWPESKIKAQFQLGLICQQFVFTL